MELGKQKAKLSLCIPIAADIQLDNDSNWMEIAIKR